MKIRLIKGWSGRSPGTVMEPELHAVATTLIARGIAEEVIEAEQSLVDSRKKPKLQDWVKNPKVEI